MPESAATARARVVFPGLPRAGQVDNAEFGEQIPYQWLKVAFVNLELQGPCRPAQGLLDI